MRSITLIIPGPPIAKKRPRFYRKGNFVGTYKDDKEQTEEGRFLFHISQQFNGPMFEGALVLVLGFYMPIRNNDIRTKKLKADMDARLIPHTKKPDVDNLEKFVLDALNNIVWRDDRAIIDVRKFKQFSDRPRTEIMVREWAGENLK